MPDVTVNEAVAVAESRSTSLAYSRFFDDHTNFAYSTVAVAPSPASSGGSLTIQSADADGWPRPPYNVVVWPTGARPTRSNAEIARVTSGTPESPVLTITRAQEGTTARSVQAGDQVMVIPGSKVFTDIEDSILSKTLTTVGRTKGCDYLCDGVADNVQIQQAVNAVSSAGGGTVFLKRGFYFIASVLNIFDNVKVMGEGNATVLILASGTAIKVVATKVVLAEFAVDGSNQSLNNFGMLIQDSDNVRIRDCNLLNMTGFGIFVSSSASGLCKNIDIYDNYLYGLGRNDVIGGGPNNSTLSVVSDINIHDNRIIQDCTTNSYENVFDIVRVKNVSFHDNICTGKIQFGTEQFPNINSKFSDNLIEPALGKTTTAILVTTFGSATDNTDSIGINDNTVIDGSIKVTGISGQKSKHLSITGNTIEGQSIANGMELVQCSGATIQGNTINQVTAGIYLENCDNIAIDGNQIDTATYGVRDVTGVPSIKVGESNVFTNVTTHVVGTYLEPYAQGNVSGGTTFNVANGKTINATLTGNITVTLTAGEYKNQLLTLRLTQDSTGSRTVTWPSNFKKAGGSLTLSTAANAVDIINIKYDGTNWIEQSRALNVS